MSNEQQRHDSRDQVWNLLAPHRSGQRGQWGGTAQDNQRSINGVFWILHTGAHGGGAAVLREMGYCISAFSQMSLIWNGR